MPVQAGGWVWRGIAPWTKKFGRPVPGRFTNAAEYVVWGSSGPMAERDAYTCGAFECSPPSGDVREHVAQKPLGVMHWIISATEPGAIVLDPFIGSGTTLVAAKDLGHQAIGVESDERYCEMAARRLGQTVLPFDVL